VSALGVTRLNYCDGEEVFARFPAGLSDRKIIPVESSLVALLASCAAGRFKFLSQERRTNSGAVSAGRDYQR